MKALMVLNLIVFSAFMASAQTTRVSLTVGAETRNVTLYDNLATETLIDLLKEGSIKVRMSDYGGFEKVGTLPQSFPTSNSQISTHPGDIMLYQGNQMVIFYGSNSWSYTPLGRIDNATADNVKEFLGSGTVEVTISLPLSNGINDVVTDPDTEEVVYDLNGCIVTDRPLAPGLYIINQKKVAIR